MAAAGGDGGLARRVKGWRLLPGLAQSGRGRGLRRPVSVPSPCLGLLPSRRHPEPSNGVGLSEQAGSAICSGADSLTRCSRRGLSAVTVCGAREILGNILHPGSWFAVEASLLMGGGVSRVWGCERFIKQILFTPNWNMIF